MIAAISANGWLSINGFTLFHFSFLNWKRFDGFNVNINSGIHLYFLRHKNWLTFNGFHSRIKSEKNYKSKLISRELLTSCSFGLSSVIFKRTRLISRWKLAVIVSQHKQRGKTTSAHLIFCDSSTDKTIRIRGYLFYVKDLLLNVENDFISLDSTSICNFALSFVSHLSRHLSSHSIIVKLLQIWRPISHLMIDFQCIFPFVLKICRDRLISFQMTWQQLSFAIRHLFDDIFGQSFEFVHTGEYLSISCPSRVNIQFLISKRFLFTFLGPHFRFCASRTWTQVVTFSSGIKQFVIVAWSEKKCYSVDLDYWKRKKKHFFFLFRCFCFFISARILRGVRSATNEMEKREKKNDFNGKWVTESPVVVPIDIWMIDHYTRITDLQFTMFFSPPLSTLSLSLSWFVIIKRLCHYFHVILFDSLRSIDFYFMLRSGSGTRAFSHSCYIFETARAAASKCAKWWHVTFVQSIDVNDVFPLHPRIKLKNRKKTAWLSETFELERICNIFWN